MALSVKLQMFEGPLDLLLHLIDKDKIDIYDIPIAQITQQYLEYMQQMQTEDMNIMSEFLVMAATLLDIKCRMLLPAQPQEEDAQEDPRAELVQKLLEYKMYKYMSYELKDRQVDAARNFYKPPTLPPEVACYKQPVDYAQLVGDTDLAKLHAVFKSVIKKQEDKIDPIRSRYGRIEKDEISMEAKARYVEEYIGQHPKCSFRKLLEKSGSRMEIIVTFLVILELIKIGRVFIQQEEIFDDIIVMANT